MKELTASITIEASLIIPIILLLFVMVMQTGISLYTETKTAALDMIEDGDWNAAKEFNRWNMMADTLRK